MKNYTAKSLLEARVEFNRKWHNSFAITKKAAHLARATAVAKLNKRTKMLQKEIIAAALKRAGKFDDLGDIDILNDYRKDYEISKHHALIVLRNSHRKPLSFDETSDLAQIGTGRKCAVVSTKDIEDCDFEIAALKDLLARVKDGSKLIPYHKVLEMEDKIPDGLDCNDYSQATEGDSNLMVIKGGVHSAAQLNIHTQRAYRDKDTSDHMTVERAREILENSTHMVNSQEARNTYQEAEEAGQHTLNAMGHTGGVPEGYALEFDSTAVNGRLVKI